MDVISPFLWVVVAGMIFAILMAIFSLIFERDKEYLAKLAGTGFIIAASFAANNWFVYALAIFVTATLVTDLKFLEKMMALIWGRKEYWDYLIKASTPDEIKKQIQKEAEEQKVPKNKIPDYVTKTLEFEDRVLNLLMHPEFGLFYGGKLIRNPQVLESQQTLMIDALVELNKYIFLIEVKNSSAKELKTGIGKLRAFESALKNAMDKRLTNGREIKLLVITSETESVGNLLTKDIAVLKVDKNLSSFTNKGPVLNWIEKS